MQSFGRCSSGAILPARSALARHVIAGTGATLEAVQMRAVYSSSGQHDDPSRTSARTCPSSSSSSTSLPQVMLQSKPLPATKKRLVSLAQSLLPTVGSSASSSSSRRRSPRTEVRTFSMLRQLLRPDCGRTAAISATCPTLPIVLPAAFSRTPSTARREQGPIRLTRSFSIILCGGSSRGNAASQRPSSMLLSGSNGTAASQRQKMTHYLLGGVLQHRAFAGRAGGRKRKRKSDVVKTNHQKTEFGKRMEFFWQRNARRFRVPLIENSRQHLVYDCRFKTWMTMWYKDGIQVFKRHGGNASRSEGFERARMRALLLYQQLKQYAKLGRPKPDVTFSGVRGVIWDTEERAWVCRWAEAGMQRWHVFPVNAENSFGDAYARAVKMRLEVLQRNHHFVMQRSRWKNLKDFLGTSKT
ncbi:unnamed protein product [Amoebophrya sp. A25]|nr:unnamed protein product [Amoebophrya sp. A25]|eukprot:GSA25T00013165001.1